MGVSKINFGNRTLIDLTGDTVTADSLQEGYTAHGADGEPIVGRGTGGGNSANYYSIEDEASNAIANNDYIPFYDSTGEVKTKILFSTLKAAIDTDTKDWASITGKPETFPPSSHTHSWDSITGKPDTFTPSSHTHDNITTSTLTSAKDANTVGANGKLTVDSFIAGSSQSLPDSSNAFTVMTSKNSDGTKAFQIAGSSTSHYAYFRNYADGTGWSNWYSMRNTNVTVTNNLTSSSSTGTALSAAQGYNLANGSARDSTKMPLAGGTFTGQVKSSYKGAGTWIGGVTNAAFTITGSGYSAWMCGPTQSGNISISTYTSTNSLYFGYAVSGRTDNSFNQQMSWDAANNILYAGKFSGKGNVNRVAKDANSALPGANSFILEEFNSGSNYNLPSNHWYFIFSMQGGDGNYGAQLALGMTTQGAYYRKYDNKTWSSWVAFKTQADINSAVAAAKVGTAGQAQVLSGYTFTNASTSGLTGTMTNRGSATNAVSVGVNTSSGNTYHRIPNGAYLTNAGSGYPEIVTPLSTYGGATTAQVLSGCTFTSTAGLKVTGSIGSKAAATYYTSTSDQTITSGQYLSGTQTIKAVTTSNISAGNIKKGVVVKVGDANNAGRIANVTGTYAPTLVNSKTLWSNSNTSTNFAEQTITLNASFRSYTLIRIRFRYSTTNSTVDEAYFTPSSLSSSKYGTNGYFFCAIGGNRESGTQRVRRIEYVSDTSFKISHASNIGKEGTSNSQLIPIDICGMVIS